MRPPQKQLPRYGGPTALTRALGPAPEPAARGLLSCLYGNIGRSGVVGLAGGRLAAALLSWLWLILAARQLSLAEFGDLALLLALGSIFSVIADLGLPLIVMQQSAKQPDVAFSAALLAVRRRLPAALAASAVVVGAFAITASRPSIFVPAIFGVSIVSTAVYTSVTAALRGVGRPRAEAINDITARLFVLVVGGYWVSRGGGIFAAVVIYAAADLASAVALSMLARRQLSSKLEASAAAFSLRANAPLAVAGVLGSVYYRIDVWLLAAMSGSRTVALYTAAYRLLDGLLIPAGALSALMVPLTARLRSAARLVLIDRLARSAMVLAALVSVIGILSAEPIITRTFGADYNDAAGALKVLLLGLVPGVAILVIAPVAALADRRAFVRMVSVSLVLNIVANVALIPTHGAVGAACATLLSQAVLAVNLRWSLGRSTKSPDADA